MQGEVSKPVPQIFIGLSPDSTMISASFSVLSVDAENNTITLSNSTTTGVTRSVDPETGSNIITVEFPENVTHPTASFSLILDIPDPDTLGWFFAENSAVFHDITGSTVPAGIVVNPVNPGLLNVEFWIDTTPSVPDTFPTFRCSLAFQRIEDGLIINIDDPTVILKPPPPE